jgi:anti-sigma B factor antagonist
VATSHQEECNLDISETRRDSVTIVDLSGQVGSVHAVRLTQYLGGLIDRSDGPVVIDLSRIAHMTSAGLRSLLVAQRRSVEKGTKVLLCGLPSLIREIMDITGLLDVFTVVPTPADAMQRLAAATSH